MTPKIIQTEEEYKEVIENNDSVLIYFGTQSCGVSESMEEKVYGLIEEKFPKIKFFYVNINFSPKITATYNAFSEPTVLVYFSGKEYVRKSRHFGLFELENAIERIYNIFY
ncbi:thioredoxin family protein [Aureivirga sp. CE67]|uniref:thioredoxin family protein n=1 Tax=Aureivirga sp. CE67 TaxID=1788983 RepID=UPI0018CB0432|nr:thioredoxin family protein [Aureivirga sp. CE67]